MILRPNLLAFLEACSYSPVFGRARRLGLRVWCEANVTKGLKKTDKEERDFVVSELDNELRKKSQREKPSRHTCCPRQILGPALNGRNMNGFGVKYLCKRSSMNLSGSNSRAGKSQRGSVALYGSE